MLNCAILGATGYTGVELIKILLRHSQVRLTALTTRQKESIPVQQLVPSLPKDLDLEVRSYTASEIRRSADAVFLCLPHTEAMEAAAEYRKAGKLVIDLSADFRLRDWKTYEAWYGVKHTRRELLGEAVYGLPELYREKIKRSDFIANPGCYPTGTILGVAPLLKKKLVESTVIVDAKSGASGAGKKLNASTQFCELDENFYAYKVTRHQHVPEIRQVLEDAAGGEVSLTFVPHLLPIDRGLLSTIYLKRRKGVKPEQIAKAYAEAYQEEPFVRVKPEGVFPALRDVQRTNYCDIGFWADPDSDRVIVITAIDNLVKGASGQAVQNLNIRSGFDEGEGLSAW